MRALLFFLVVWPGLAFAFTVDTPLADAVQEARAKTLFHAVRCVVCAGESVADSRVEIAADLRTEIRRRVSIGEEDTVILDALSATYGDAILMQPPLKLKTLLLWFSPLLMIGLGSGILFAYFFAGRISRRRP